VLTIGVNLSGKLGSLYGQEYGGKWVEADNYYRKSKELL